MNRIVDRGAITAAYVGIGMAITIVASFTLIIPIEWLIWLLAVPSGLLIGYYANQRSNQVARTVESILRNGLFAGVVTGLTVAVLLLLIKAIFFYADNGFRDPGLGGPINSSPGPTASTSAAVWAPFALPALPAAMRAFAAFWAAALPVCLATCAPAVTCVPPSAALTLRVRRDLRRAAAFGWMAPAFAARSSALSASTRAAVGSIVDVPVVVAAARAFDTSVFAALRRG